MAAMSHGQESDTRVPWAVPTTCRGQATLGAKDSFLRNGYICQDENGTKWVRPRPGLGLVKTTASTITRLKMKTISVGSLGMKVLTYGGPGDTTSFLWYESANTPTAAVAVVTPTAIEDMCESVNPSYHAAGVEASGKVFGWDGNVTITEAGPFAQFVGNGVVVATESMEGIMYVLTKDGYIYNSAVNDITSFSALDFLRADGIRDIAVTMVRHGAFLLVFGGYHVEVFYNAANPSPGSPLAKYSTSLVEYGAAGNVVRVGDDIYYVARKLTGVLRLVRIRSGSTVPEEVGSPSMNRIINTGAYSGVWATLLPTENEVLVLTNGANPSIVFDPMTDCWALWDSALLGTIGATAIASATYSGAFNAASARGFTYVAASPSAGVVKFYSVNASTFRDEGGVFTFQSMTANVDYGNRFKKFPQRAELLGDVAAQAFALEYSDDDYGTFSASRTMDASQPRPIAQNLGSSRRRAWRLTASPVTAEFRVEALELIMDAGSQ